MRFILLILMIYTYSFGCGCKNGTTIDGKWVEYRPNSIHHDVGSPIELLNAQGSTTHYYFREHFSIDKEDNNLTQAVSKMLNKNYTEAIEQLLKEEKTEDVVTALSLAYEFSDDNVNALKWFRFGLEHDFESYYEDSELHLSVLDAQIKLQNDQKYMHKHHILDPLSRHNGYDIRQYLEKRMLYVKPKNPIVADLLFTYAIAHANEGYFLEYSLEVLKIAQQYGYSNPQELKQTTQRFQKIIDDTASAQNLKLIIYIALFFLVIFIIYMIRKRMSIRKETDENSTDKQKGYKVILINFIYLSSVYPIFFAGVSMIAAFAFANTTTEALLISGVATIPLEYIAFKVLKGFLKLEDLQMKKVKYGLGMIIIMITLVLSITLIEVFNFKVDSYPLMLLAGVFAFLGFISVASGLEAKRKNKEETIK